MQEEVTSLINANRYKRRVKEELKIIKIASSGSVINKSINYIKPIRIDCSMDYLNLVGIYQKLDSTTKRLEKTHIIAGFLKTVKTEDLGMIMLLLQGKLYPNWDEHKIGIASRLVIKAINVATGISSEKIEQEWKKTGDLGDVAERLVGVKKQATLFVQSLTVKKVFENLRKLAELEGIGTVDRKMQLIAELMTSAKPLEAKYIIRTLLEELRVGVGEGSLRDAIVWAFFADKIGFTYSAQENDFVVENREEYNKYTEAVQQAYDLANDFAVVAELAKTKGIKGLLEQNIVIGRPLKVMLALKVDDIKEGFERCGMPADIEYKLDGFRMQLHKDKNNIVIFTRRLENVTRQFPEVIEWIKKQVKGDSFILDSEAVGYNKKTSTYMPFQHISQRIKRKYDIEKLAETLPVELNVFDILYYNGKNLLKEPFQKRRALLEKIITPISKKIVLVRNIITSSEKEAGKFYKESIEEGNEGVIFKNLESPYKPGARVGHMCKLKGEEEALDLVIVAAEWGEGKRSTWLSSYTLACIDENGNYLDVGKASTGLKEKEEEGLSFKEMTEELKPLILSEKGKEVKLKPQIVVEVGYEEIQKSPTYSSGFALRFPRIKRLRSMERSPEDITTLSMIEDLYYKQKKT